MQFGYSETCMDHDTGERHPETADRLVAIRRALQRRHGVAYIDAPPASRAAITAVHAPVYVDQMEAFITRGGGNWDPDTVAHPGSWAAATTAAGLAVWAAEAAADGATGRETPFAIGRPPGHHAVSDDAMGFCLLNNAAIAAQALLDAPERDVERVLIFDWDVHHGNGIQDIFYADPAVCYVSIHEAGLYPGTGGMDERGVDAGAGTTMNFPLTAGAGDPEYLAIVEEAIAPAIASFAPDVVLVAAGFDAHRHDPISRMQVSTEGFGAMTAAVDAAAQAVDAGVAYILEGGYGLDTLAQGVATVHETYDGRTPTPQTGSVDPLVTELIEAVRID